MEDANVDEDAPISSIHKQQNAEEIDASDEVQDFRFLASLGTGHKIPKRGEKDFERHGTRAQEGALEASRQAMHEALSYTRVHAPKNHVRAWFLGDGVEGQEDALNDPARGTGLEKDRVVMVENAKGPLFRTMGKAASGTKKARLWLLPEEALYLVERGNLDLWWPRRALDIIRGDFDGIDEDCGEEEEDFGLPLSLQAAYALLLGGESEEGKVPLDTYNIYANLKRTGYIVLRATAMEKSLPQPQDLFKWLFGYLFAERDTKFPPYGPLIHRGLYRSYNQVYRQLSIIPRHVPSPTPPETSFLPSFPFKIFYFVLKPSRIPTYAKSNPGQPDFRVAIISAQETTMPSLQQLTSLLESTPWDPPSKDWTGPAKSYQRLKHGWRNTVLAIVDRGVISYLRMAEAAFGEEKLYERFDSGAGRGGGKRGGFRGRGRGRGRGGGR